jgi:hypothetical protein
VCPGSEPVASLPCNENGNGDEKKQGKTTATKMPTMREFNHQALVSFC